MRLSVIILATVLAVAVAGCGGQKSAAPVKEAPKLTRLVTVASGDVVSVDPDTLRVSGAEVNALLLFTKKEVRNGVTTESWDVSLKPSERLIAVKAKLLYNEAGLVVSADTAGAGWELIIPDSDTERIMQAVVDYAKKRGLAVNATPPPYALPGFKYLAKSTANNAYYLYKPASVRTSGGQISVEMLMIHEGVVNGSKYAITTVNLRAADRKYQTAAQTLYDAAGKQVASHSDAKWYDIPPHSVMDMLLDVVRR